MPTANPVNRVNNVYGSMNNFLKLASTSNVESNDRPRLQSLMSAYSQPLEAKDPPQANADNFQKISARFGSMSFLGSDP